MNKKQLEDFKSIKIVSILLCIVITASTAALFLYRAASRRAYNEKWKDYDDCGLG